MAPPAARRWRWAYPLVLLALAASTVVLSIAGAQLILDSRDGETARSELDPTKPGYLAAVAATPTLLVVHADEDDLYGAVVLALGANDAGQHAAVIPAEMVVQTRPDAPARSLADIYDESGVEDLTTGDGVRAAVSILLGADFDSVVTVDDASLAPLIEPVAPLRYSLPDPVRGSEGAGTLLPAGPVEVATADDVAAATQPRGAGDEPDQQATRVQRFWQAWIDEVAAAPEPAAALPPSSSGTQIGRFVTGLAAGEARVDIVPYTTFLDAVVIDPGAAPEFVQRLIPFPRQAGVRLSTAVYNGVGNLELNKTVNHDLVAAGAEIVSIGNTNVFDVETSTVVYHDAELRSRAEQLADAIDVTDVRFDDKPDSTVDVTVTIGADYSP